MGGITSSWGYASTIGSSGAANVIYDYRMNLSMIGDTVVAVPGQSHDMLSNHSEIREKLSQILRESDPQLYRSAKVGVKAMGIAFCIFLLIFIIGPILMFSGADPKLIFSLFGVFFGISFVAFICIGVLMCYTSGKVLKWKQTVLPNISKYVNELSKSNQQNHININLIGPIMEWSHSQSHSHNHSGHHETRVVGEWFILRFTNGPLVEANWPIHTPDINTINQPKMVVMIQPQQGIAQPQPQVQAQMYGQPMNPQYVMPQQPLQYQQQQQQQQVLPQYPTKESSEGQIRN